VSPSTWEPFRLAHFAKPYKSMLLLGFILMLISTAATLVSPYLMEPLMNNVPINYQNNKLIDVHLDKLYLSALLAAWNLGWARTYILAMVTLIPLLFIALMIHVVQARLERGFKKIYRI